MPAPTITVEDLAVAIRVIAAADATLHDSVRAQLTRLRSVAFQTIADHAPEAPTEVADEAAVRMVGWMYDTDPAARRPALDILTTSGAAGLLARWRVRRVLTPSGGLAPVPGPVPDPSAPGVDPEARQAAARALAAAGAAQDTADANTGFLATFAARVRGVVEAIVPAWARQRNPPAGQGVADGAVTTPKLADGAVTAAKLADEAVTGRKLAADSVASGHLVDAAVTTAKLERNAVTGEKIAPNAIERGQMRDGSVGDTELVDAAVTEAKLADGATTTDKVADAAVTEAKLAAAVAEKLNKAGSAALTHAQQIDLLQFTVIPQVVIGYEAAAVTLDWRVWVSGAEVLPDTWVALTLETLTTLAAPPPSTPGADLKRHKLSATTVYQFTLAEANRTTLVDGRKNKRQGRSIEAELRFYDAISGGKLVDRRQIGVDWLAAPAAPPDAGLGVRAEQYTGQQGVNIPAYQWQDTGLTIPAAGVMLVATVLPDGYGFACVEIAALRAAAAGKPGTPGGDSRRDSSGKLGARADGRSWTFGLDRNGGLLFYDSAQTTRPILYFYFLT